MLSCLQVSSLPTHPGDLGACRFPRIPRRTRDALVPIRRQEQVTRKQVAPKVGRDMWRSWGDNRRHRARPLFLGSLHSARKTPGSWANDVHRGNLSVVRQCSNWPKAGSLGQALRSTQGILGSWIPYGRVSVVSWRGDWVCSDLPGQWPVHRTVGNAGCWCPWRACQQ
jgi:hypothetical protein